MSRKYDFTFNRIYKGMFTTDKRVVDLYGGRGRGGSYTGTDYFLFKITQPGYFRGYFLRQSFNDIRDSLFRDFKDRIEENTSVTLDEFNINENEMRIIYLPTGNMIMSKGVRKDSSRTAKLKSLAGATDVLIEETDELGEEDYDQLDLSLRTVKAPVRITRIFNPPHKLHWIWRDYNLLPCPEEELKGYYRAEAKQSSDVLGIFSTYRDNVKNIQESTVNKFESFRIRKPEYYRTVIQGLISEGAKGRIYSSWQPITNDFFNQIEARSIIGIDFGSNTGGIVEVKIVKNKVYLRELSYGGLTVKEIGIKLAQLGIVNHLCICDSAEPITIAKLRRGWDPAEISSEEAEKYPVLLTGFNAVSVTKLPGSVVTGIDSVKDNEVFATEDSHNLWNEFREYKWALDKNKNPTDEPEDKFNHLMDPTRYVVMSRGSLF